MGSSTRRVEGLPADTSFPIRQLQPRHSEQGHQSLQRRFFHRWLTQSYDQAAHKSAVSGHHTLCEHFTESFHRPYLKREELPGLVCLNWIQCQFLQPAKNFI